MNSSARRPFRLAYDTIKRELQAGDYTSMAQLKASAIASRLGLSATPVREALARLSGEHLIDDRRDQGYFVPALTGRHCGELYWLQENCLAAGLAADLGARRRLEGPAATGIDPAIASGAIKGLTEAIASLCFNHNLLVLVRNLNDRLAGVRRAEAELLPSTIRDDLTAACIRADNAALRKAIHRYFGVCIRQADAIVDRVSSGRYYTDNID